MTTSTVAQNTTTGKTPVQHGPAWQTLLFVGLVLALFAISLWLRLHDLGVQFDRDSYDESVYWQTLRAMSEGYPLYRQVFYSQPPIFMLATFPIYALFGQTIWAARLGMVLLSLLGLLGAWLLGYALRGRIGALAALLLLVANPLYLTQSQTLQAEAPCVALELLAVALAYLWWQHPEGWQGICLAALSTIVLVLSIMSKLFGVAALVPIGLLALARLWLILCQPSIRRGQAATSLLVGIAAFIIAIAVVLLPFAGSWPQFLQQVISFHVAAGHALKAKQANNLATLRSDLATLLTLAALYGTVVALLRRDWRVIPLLGWLLATLYLLWDEVPLFQHHLVILVAPLISLALMGITAFSLKQPQIIRATRTWQAATLLPLLLIVVVSGLDLRDSCSYLRTEHGRNMAATSNTNPQQQVVKDLQTYTQPNQLVITDSQFLVALAGRSTPPDLVDTSSVRVQSGYLTARQLMTDAARPQVQAILFYTGRLRLPQLAPFDTWVTTHYRLVRNYGNGNGLWIKIA
jgi:4-amino-4-deoxy-L-arabinose transferase-like glycosyltransferase